MSDAAASPRQADLSLGRLRRLKIVASTGMVVVALWSCVRRGQMTAATTSVVMAMLEMVAINVVRRRGCTRSFLLLGGEQIGR